MNNTRYQCRPGPSVEYLAQRHELLCIMHKSHIRWMEETADEKMRELHHTLASTFVRLIEQYDMLLHALQGSNPEN